MSRPLVFVMIATIALFGAGCTKQAANSPVKNGSPAAVAQNTQEQPAEQMPQRSPAEELGTILARFREHKSFRARLSMPESAIPLTGTMEFSKPSRMRASIHMGSSDVMDIIIAGANVYERENGGQWKDISALPEGVKLTTILYGITSGKSSLSNYGVSSNDKVEKSRDEAKKCDLYVAELKGRDGKINTINVCASNDLVRYVKISTKDNGPVTFEYYDHDDLFLIERPI